MSQDEYYTNAIRDLLRHINREDGPNPTGPSIGTDWVRVRPLEKDDRYTAERDPSNSDQGRFRESRFTVSNYDMKVGSIYRVVGISAEGVLLELGKSKVRVPHADFTTSFIQVTNPGQRTYPGPLDPESAYQGIGRPAALSTRTAQLLADFQDLVGEFASLAVTMMPNVPDRDRMLDALRDVQDRGERAIKFGRTVITPAVFADHLAAVEARDERVMRAWLNSTQFADVRKNFGGNYTPSTDPLTIRGGSLGMAFNAELRSSKKIPFGYIYLADTSSEEDLDPDWTPDPAKLIRL